MCGRASSTRWSWTRRVRGPRGAGVCRPPLPTPRCARADPYAHYVEEARRNPDQETKPGGVIDRDLDRTFPRCQLFADRGGLGQTQLRNVLIAFAAFRPDVGYFQGMNFFTALFLSFVPEDVRALRGPSAARAPPRRASPAALPPDCVCHAVPHRTGAAAQYAGIFFHASWEHTLPPPPSKCACMPSAPMRGAMGPRSPPPHAGRAQPRQLRGLLRAKLPRLHRHFEAEGIDVAFFSTEVRPPVTRCRGLAADRPFACSLQWFVTVYSRSFPFGFVVHVWDIFLNEGWKIVFRIALTILKANQRAVLAPLWPGPCAGRWVKTHPHPAHPCNPAPLAKLLQLDMEGIMLFFRHLLYHVRARACCGRGKRHPRTSCPAPHTVSPDQCGHPG